MPNPWMLQSWRRVGFLHWRVDAALVASRLPDRLEPELHDGSAWVSLLLFMVEGARPPMLAPLPLVSQFPEANLRTYVVGPDGPGLWFHTIEADTVVTSVGARLFYGAPYVFADMAIDGDADPAKIAYTSRRRRPFPPASIKVVLGVGEPLEEGERTELDDQLTGQWRAYTTRAGALAYGLVEHEPWPLHRATAIEVDQSVSDACGLGPLGPPELAHFSPGVHARLSRPHSASPPAEPNFER